MRVILGACFLAIICSEVALAKVPNPPLMTGMGTEEVVKSWGPPQEKIERETKREEIWRYPEGDLIFRQGHLVNFPGFVAAESKNSVASSAESATDNVKVSPTGAKVTHSGDGHPMTIKQPVAQATKEVHLNEIFGEVKRGMPPDTDTQKNPRPNPAGPPGMNSFMGPMGRPGPANHPGEVEADIY